MIIRRNARTEQAGLMLTHHVSPAVAVAFDHLDRELKAFDGWPSRGDAPGRGTSTSTVPEAAALARLKCSNDIDDLRGAIDNVEIAVRHLAKLANDALGRRVAPSTDVPRCRDGQVGLDGRDDWCDDFNCLALPVKSKLCQRHYSQWQRYKAANGVDRSADYEPGAA